LNPKIFHQCLSNISQLELGKVQLRYHGEPNIPNLLTIYEIIHPLNIALSSIKKNIEELKDDKLGDGAVKGLFVLGISNLETMLSDLLKSYIAFYPNKLSLLKSETDSRQEKVEFKISRDNLYSGNILEGVIGKEVDKLFYKRIENLFNVFYRIFSINNDMNNKEKIFQQLVEIKESRNLLLHNNLFINEQYLYKTHDIKRGTEIGKQLIISARYALDSLLLIQTIIEDIERKVLNKYAKFTLLRMLNGLWAYTFKEHIRFEDHFTLNEENDIFDGPFKESQYSLASSEIFLMQLWKAQRFGAGIDNFALVHITNSKKIAFLVEVFGNMRLTYW
jgi:hypothetical protein